MTQQFLWGALAMACAVAGLFFLKFWRATRERLFLVFAAAFWVLGANWVALAIADPSEESRHYLYVVRLVAFLLLIAGILDKNRKRR
jgi:hypothetical protein